MYSILVHILWISFPNLALVKWQVLVYKTLLEKNKSKENIFKSKEL